MKKYTIESLKPLNAVYDSEHELKQSDVDTVNDFVRLIESTRKEKPCPGDIVDYTNEYGEYNQNTNIQAFDDEKGLLTIRICPHVPIMSRDGDKQEIGFYHTGGGPLACVDYASLSYIGKREKLFAMFGGCLLPVHRAIYFKASVNVWEYVAPAQKYPGYSMKDWGKQYISYMENPGDGCVYHYYGQDIAFKDAAEWQRWKETYKAVEFPGGSPNQIIFFLYREINKLVPRKEWDALGLPLDTRRVNGIIHVKADYDDDAHVITAYRFTNSGYLNPKRFDKYERAKGTALVPPGPEIAEEIPYIIIANRESR